MLESPVSPHWLVRTLWFRERKNDLVKVVCSQNTEPAARMQTLFDSIHHYTPPSPLECQTVKYPSEYINCNKRSFLRAIKEIGWGSLSIWLGGAPGGGGRRHLWESDVKLRHVRRVGLRQWLEKTPRRQESTCKGPEACMKNQKTLMIQ